MSAFAPVLLSPSTGSDVSFAPLAISPQGVASYATAEPVYDAKRLMTISTKVPSAQSTKARLKLKLTLPLMDTIDTTKKLDEAIVNVDFSFPKQMGQLDRRDLNSFLVSALQQSLVTAFVDSFEGVY